MNNVKKRLLENPKAKLFVGLQTCTEDELRELKLWLQRHGIKYTHTTSVKTLGKSGRTKLHGLGLLKINPRGK